MKKNVNLWPERDILFSGRKARERLNSILERFPHRSEQLAVLGVAVFVCYSWTLLGFLNRLSSFLLHFMLVEIADIFAFMMAFTLLESLTVTGVLVLMSAVLPSAWLRDGFALKGFIVIVIATLTSILFQKSLGDDYPSALYGATALRKRHRISFASIEDNLVEKGEGFDSSLFIGPLIRLFTLRDRLIRSRQFGSRYPPE